MKEQIEAYAKRLKLSWIREHYHEIEAESNHDYLLQLFEREVQNREKRKVNLLLKQAQLPKTGTNHFNGSIFKSLKGLIEMRFYKGNSCMKKKI